MSLLYRFASWCVLATAASIAVRQPLAVDPAPLLLTGAIVHPISGPALSPGQVLIRDGVIAEVGANIDATGARHIDLHDHHLYPGLIDATSSLGLLEISAVRATSDTTESGEFTPDVQAWMAVNPDSELLGVARANGLTHALVVPKGGLVTGQSGLIQLSGWTSEEMAVARPAAMHLFWPSMQLDLTPKEKAPDKSKVKSIEEQMEDRQKKIERIKEFFASAEAYAKAKKAALDSRAFETVPAWESMLPLVQGQIPLMIHANELREIKAALSWTSTNHYRIILAGGRDAWKVADQLAQAKIPVIFDQVFQVPTRAVEPYDIHFSTPALLHKASVKVIFSQGLNPDSAMLARNLPYSAAQAVAFGLPADEALKGITLYPAEILGVQKSLGSIEPGKQANLIATDGDLFDIRSHVTQMWIAGKEITLESRQTRLYQKYRQRPVN